jgi:hypothetical protein
MLAWPSELRLPSGRKHRVQRIRGDTAALNPRVFSLFIAAEGARIDAGNVSRALL